MATDRRCISTSSKVPCWRQQSNNAALSFHNTTLYGCTLTIVQKNSALLVHYPVVRVSNVLDVRSLCDHLLVRHDNKSCGRSDLPRQDSVNLEFGE
jgi:hypothetical protein